MNTITKYSIALIIFIVGIGSKVGEVGKDDIATELSSHRAIVGGLAVTSILQTPDHLDITIVITMHIMTGDAGFTLMSGHALGRDRC